MTIFDYIWYWGSALKILDNYNVFSKIGTLHEAQIQLIYFREVCLSYKIHNTVQALILGDISRTDGHAWPIYKAIFF
jgi:hypothetical protein